MTFIFNTVTGNETGIASFDINLSVTHPAHEGLTTGLESMSPTLF